MNSRTSQKIASFLYILLAAAGLAISAISLYQHTAMKHGFQQGPSFCNINSALNCDAVNASPFAEILGVPIAGYAFFFYGVLLAFFLSKGKVERLAPQRISAALTVVFILALAFSVYLFVISKLFIGALCPTCIALYLVNILLFCVATFEATQPFVRRLSLGTISLVSAPTALWSRDPAVWSFARLFLLLTIVFGGVSFYLPDVFVARVAVSSMESQELKDAIGDAVKGWEQAPPTAISLREFNTTSGDYQRGSPQAPLQIIEFSDYECPYCRNLHETVEELFNRYGEKVSFTFKNFPIDPACNPLIQEAGHENACEAAIFARCAGEQGRFWEASNYLFTLPALEESNRTKEGASKAIMDGMTVLSLDGSAMHECLAADRQLQAVRDDIQSGQNAGLQGTPFFIINGKIVSSPHPDVIKAIAEKLIGGK